MKIKLLKLFPLVLLFIPGGCVWMKRPVEATYCARCSPDKKHCEKWADHHNYPCVEDAYGDCTPRTR